MAINPVSSSLTSPTPPAVAPAAPPPPASPSLQALQVLEGAAVDPMLIDPTTAANMDQAGATQDPLLGSFNSMTGGDPLLNDLNNLDNPATNGLTSTDPVAAEDATLNQDLTSFLVQQATSQYSASQLLGLAKQPSTGSTGALGNTIA